MKSRACAYLLALFAAVGCNGQLQGASSKDPKVQIRVDSLASSTARSKVAFYVMPGMPNLQPEELEFREFKYQAEQALLYEGFTMSADASSAEIAIFLSYGIGQPQVHYETITSPTFGLVPDGSYSVNTQSQTFGNTTYSSSSVHQGQHLAVTGYETQVRTRVRYDRFLTLSAIDVAYYKATGKIGEVWRTTVTSTGSSDDLRRIFPVMMAAAMRRFAITTRGKVDVEIREHHPRARFLRREMSADELRILESKKQL